MATTPPATIMTSTLTSHSLATVRRPGLYPTNTKHFYNICTMLDQRRGRSPTLNLHWACTDWDMSEVTSCTVGPW